MKNIIPFQLSPLVNLFSQKNIKNLRLEQQSQHLLHIIKSLVKEEGVYQTFNIISSEYHSFRMEVLQINPHLLDSSFINTFSQENKNQKLEKAISDTLDVYSKILYPMYESGLIDNLKEQIEENTIDLTSFQLNNLDIMIKLYPIDNHLRQIKEFNISALLYDFSLLIAFLIKTEQLEGNKNMIKETIDCLHKAIENVGVYSSLLNYWTPNDEDETQLIRNIKIRTAIERTQFTSYNFDDLKEHLQA